MGDTEPVNGEPEERTSDATTAPRREALKKAAGAAAVAATVWAAPRVEGFSLVPAYASAGSVGARGIGGEYTTATILGVTWGIHTFTSGEDFRRTDPTLTTVQVIAVGGGGGGGFGGGGGGAVIRNTSVPVNEPNLRYAYKVVVGAGGVGRLGNTGGTGAGTTPSNPNLDIEWNTVPGGDGGSSSFAGSGGVTVLAQGGGGGGALLFYTTPGLGTTYSLALGRGSAGASGGGGGGINNSATTNRTGGNGSSSVVSPPNTNAGATSLAASAGSTVMASGQSLNPSAGFAGGPGAGWAGAGKALGVTGTVGSGFSIAPNQLNGTRLMYGQGGGGGSALGISPTGNSRNYLVDSGYVLDADDWVGDPFTGYFLGFPFVPAGSNSGGAGGYVGVPGDSTSLALAANGEPGVDGRGGGGGGGGFNWANPNCSNVYGTNSGRGGSGVVYVRYPL